MAIFVFLLTVLPSNRFPRRSSYFTIHLSRSSVAANEAAIFAIKIFALGADKRKLESELCAIDAAEYVCAVYCG